MFVAHTLSSAKNWIPHLVVLGSSGGTNGKELMANAGDIKDVGSIPGSGRSPGVGNVNLLQSSFLENLVDRGAGRTTVQRATQVGHDWSDLACTYLAVLHLPWAFQTSRHTQNSNENWRLTCQSTSPWSRCPWLECSCGPLPGTHCLDLAPRSW